MKYSCSVQIDASITKVAELWENEKFFKEWQDGFESYELLEGIANTKGARSKIILNGNHRIELIETILSAKLPEEKIALYEHVHMDNTQTTRFKAIDKNTTLYISEVEYLKFNGFMIKLIAKLFPGKFKKQSQKWMDQFKSFVERAN